MFDEKIVEEFIEEDYIEVVGDTAEVYDEIEEEIE